MHSFLICQGTTKTRREKVRHLIARLRAESGNKSELIRSDPDTFILRPDPTIGIETIRGITSSLKFKPFRSKAKIVVIIRADRMTREAQHAILKTLEEPAPNSFLILETRNQYSLIPTIRSRCQLMLATSPSPRSTIRGEAVDLARSLMEPSLSLRLKAVGEIDQKEAKARLRQILMLAREKMKLDPWWYQVVKLTHQTILDLDANVNPRLTLEHLALRFPQDRKGNDRNRGNS